jgi:hypothetical protein
MMAQRMHDWGFAHTVQMTHNLQLMMKKKSTSIFPIDGGNAITIDGMWKMLMFEQLW